MLKSILLSVVIILLLSDLTYSQNKNKVPQYLLDQLVIAQENENIDEENRIMNILNTKYKEETHYINPAQDEYGEIIECRTDTPPYNPDWVDPDVTVYSGNSFNQYGERPLDLKMGKDGNMYLATCVNGTFRGIRLYRSTNSGLTWQNTNNLIGSGGAAYEGLSMLVERNHSSNNDSIRVIIFFTYSDTVMGYNSKLRMWSVRPSGGLGSVILKTIASPGTGNQFRWVSAVSNGMFQSTGTDVGVVVGECANNPYSKCIYLRYYYMGNFTWSFQGVYYTDPYQDFKPFAAYKDISGTDSVYIATHREFSTNSQIRIIKIRFTWGTNTWPTSIVTSNTSHYHATPVLNIVQNPQACDKMIITYIRSGYARYSYSINGGINWNEGQNLSSSNTIEYTWVSTDTNATFPTKYCTLLWGNNDSVNIKRTSINGISGTTYYKRNSNTASLGGLPVCVVYNNSSGNYKRSAFAYWGSNDINIYFDSEDLPTGTTNTNGIANNYRLEQNNPNPFNPRTSIKFSIPKNGLVKLVVYDVLGKKVATLVNEVKTTGTHEITFDASNLNSGAYFYKLTSGDFSDVKKMLLVK